MTVLGIKIEVLIVYAVIIVLIIVGFFVFRIFRKRMNKKLEDQKTIVNEHKMPASIFVLEKRKAKITEAKLPKNIADQIPAIYKLKKMPLITAKVGPQVVTLVCEDDIYDQIPDKKNVNVELAGIFIVSVKQSTQKPGKGKSKRKRK